MKKSIFMLLILFTIALLFSGCTTENESSKNDNKKNSDSTQQTIEASKDNSKNSGSNSSSSSNSNSSSSNQPYNPLDQYTPEEQKVMGDLTGTWQLSNALADGNANVVKVKIDNIGGFTITTGTQGPDGTGSFYSRVGSYEILENNLIRFSATTGGESSDGESYQLRQDPGVYEYTFSENPELTQLSLTPVNDNAKGLTGDGNIVLNKA